MKSSKIFNVPEIFEQETEYHASSGISYSVYVRYNEHLMPCAYVLQDRFGRETSLAEFSFNDQQHFLRCMSVQTAKHLRFYKQDMLQYLADECAS